ncbi:MULTISPECIES: hypothetical protein [unclassified Rhodococcus (in: high G+C Gram-positive bacteria)]|uniref:hypothetical protein n=1 Tax=unclassified Rhodococcus (in: high G+C Gram-positive bacteria) TaxID=192944 RepID=UPI0020787D6C|nr:MULTISPECIES: hypothetical protein [unclassified Rhodococcus (in: high G+C Gram-positive bacteria)]
MQGLTIVALFVRRTMGDAPVFREAELGNELVAIPVVELWAGVVANILQLLTIPELLAPEQRDLPLP